MRKDEERAVVDCQQLVQNEILRYEVVVASIDAARWRSFYVTVFVFCFCALLVVYSSMCHDLYLLFFSCVFFICCFFLRIMVAVQLVIRKNYTSMMIDHLSKLHHNDMTYTQQNRTEVSGEKSLMQPPILKVSDI